MSFDFFNQNAVQPGGGPELGPNGEEILIDVQCGRINVEGKTMKPDDRKGKLRICKATDGLTHLMWGTRAEGMPYNPEDDFIIFPQEAEMKFIPKPGCFVIKFPDDASRNMFFWSQEPAGKIEDDKLVADVNAALNGESPESANEQAQLMQMLGDAGGAGLAARDPSGGPVAARAQAVRAAHEAANSALSSGADETPAVNANAVPETPAAPAKGPDPSAGTAVPPSVVNAEALRAALGSVGATPSSTPGAGAIDAAAMAAALAGANRRAAGPGLSDVLTPDAVGELLRSEDVRQRLMEHLPEEHRSTQDLEELLRTPQFQSQLERFSHALQSGQMDLAQFGLSPGAGFSVADFLSAIQKQVEEKEGGDAMQE
ncbi:adhesion regulating molecule [Micromonas commoda]|uniref:Adhesion regulating molecule n=1 Tax=Micromonas commoda (strain RCC299 / NOUM17 / CCMP2709) TaxID=296587 RepID=C1FIU3_MICCC|nr:adhesion regulating molecule [Micromonas commoda]ACO70479.1 adhesion regulating molecule [Micromonas commoda]|eukprot:XP_002509221.1 adhesion regulating molecule [Micromonas commoda]